MKGTLLKLFIMIIIFICMVVGICKYSSKEGEELNKLLDNKVCFSRTLIDMKASNNHLYWIVRIRIDSSNVKKYSQLNDNYLFPYRIKNNIAEIYCTVPIRKGLIYGKSKVYINSNMKDLKNL